MRSLRALLALAAVAAVAGCASNDESVDGPPAEADPGVLLAQYDDVTAPATGDCTGASAADAAPAAFDVPQGTALARIEGAFASGRVALDVRDEGGRRLGFAAAGPPVVVELEGVSAPRILVRAYACDGTPQTEVRVYATFRRAT